jgi:transglutaminase-like putative cysteine protease
MRDTLGAAPPGVDLVRGTAIASNVALATDTLRTLALRLSGQSLEGLDLDGGRQRLAGDTVFVRRESPRELRPSYRLPDAGADLRPFQAAEPLIQSDDPVLQAQARQIVENTRRPDRAAERLTRWVHENLRKEVTVGVPSALDVYARRAGDCNEHTVLFTALARAVGLPTRTASGLVYLDGTFYYHAWPEVWLGDWVAVDPTFGQFPADAAHLRLTSGGLARQLELVRLVGRLGWKSWPRSRRHDPTRRTHEALTLPPWTRDPVDVRLPRAERRREDHDDAHDRRHPASHRRHHPDLRHRPRA